MSSSKASGLGDPYRRPTTTQAESAQNLAPRSVGFVGVGAMGLPMAQNVMGGGLRVVAYDPDEERLLALAAAGARVVASPMQAAAEADLLVVMVATPEQLQQALFGPDGAAGGLQAGGPLVIMSSVGVDAVQDVERRLAGSGVPIIDAPVTGGVARAVTAELTVLAGCSTEALDAARPVLSTLAGTIAHCGPNVGDGQAVKLVNQLLCSVHLVVAAEALGFAEALGLQPEMVLRIIEHGAASSFMLSDRGPRMLSPTEPAVLSAIDIFVKDSSLVSAAAASVGADAPLLNRAAEAFREARANGWGRRDDSKIIDLFRRDPVNHIESQELVK